MASGSRSACSSGNKIADKEEGDDLFCCLGSGVNKSLLISGLKAKEIAKIHQSEPRLCELLALLFFEILQASIEEESNSELMMGKKRLFFI